MDYNTAVNLALILDISAFCVEHHTYHIKNYVISKDLLRRILVLMKSDHKFLVLSKLQIFNDISHSRLFCIYRKYCPRATI